MPIDHTRALRAGAVLLLSVSLGCGGDDGAKDDTDAREPASLAITADWLAGSLSYVDLDALLSGRPKHEAVTSTLDMSAYVPGPLALELTPDKKRLLVATSSGFFGVPGAGALIIDEPNVPSGPGRLLIVDIDAQTIEADLETGDAPMGIAITPDGKRAFVPHFGSGNMAIIDLTNNTISGDVEIGVFAEEVVLDDTGTVGVVGYSDRGSVRTFAAADPAGTLSAPVELEGDSAGVAFFPGTKTVLLVQAPNPLALITSGPSAGYTLIDVSDPSAPRVLEDVREEKLIGAYPAHAAPNRGTVLVPAAEDGVFGVREYALKGERVELVQDLPVGEAEFLGALGFAYDGKDSVVMAVPGQRAIMVANLDTHETHIIDWAQAAAGPADVVIR